MATTTRASTRAAPHATTACSITSSNRHLSLSDVPHRFVASYLYELPFGEGKKFATSGLLKHLAGGWQLGGNVVWQSGFPIAINGASSGAALARPDRVDGVDFEVPGTCSAGTTGAPR